MSVLRQGNWLGQQRVDVPHIRAVESSIAADFDVGFGTFFAGQTPQVVRGFNLVTTNAVGNPASNLQMVVAGAGVIHYGASESGSIFWVPSTRANETLNSSNANLVGAFTAQATNYVGIDLIRTADTTTSDNVQFLDANTLTEFSRTVPLGRTLNYKIIISLAPFSASSNICPIAKVLTDGANNVSSIVDARNSVWRLATGGDQPNTKFAYTWSQGRNEGTNTDAFAGGDKSFQSHVDWADGIMTRLWELGGGEYWYSGTADRNVRTTGEGSVLGTSGDYYSWDGTTLTWQNLVMLFDNSTGYYNEISNGTQILPNPGDCIYVDIDRTQNRTRSGLTSLTPVYGNINTLGTPSVPGSRFVLAWKTANSNVVVRDRQFSIGNSLSIATTTTLGTVKLSGTPTTAGSPVVATVETATFRAFTAGIYRDPVNSLAGAGAVSILGGSNTSTAMAIAFDNLPSVGTNIVPVFHFGAHNSTGSSLPFLTIQPATVGAGTTNIPRDCTISVPLTTSQTASTLVLQATSNGATAAGINFSVTGLTTGLATFNFQSVGNGFLQIADTSASAGTPTGANILCTASNSTLTVRGNRTAADTGTDVVTGGASGVTRSAGLLLDIQNNTTSKIAFDFNGKVKVPTGVIAGQATLVAGTVTVSTAAVTASSLIFLTRGTNSGTAAGVLTVGTITAATSFVINSITAGGTAVQTGDTAVVNWWIIN
jgi:hypothetical protein